MAKRAAEESTAEPVAASWGGVLDSAEVGVFLRNVMDEMLGNLGGSGGGAGWAITIVRAGVTGTWAADTPRTVTIDGLQHSFEDGPALTAVRCNEFVHVGETSLERRWPGYGHAAAGYGVLSLLSLPLILDGEFAATTNLYAPLPHFFSSADIMTAGSYAQQGRRGLRLALELIGKKEGTAAHIPAIGSRDLVGSALRILMDEYRLSYEAAFHYLHTAARSRSTGPEQAALEIIAAGPQSGSSPHIPAGSPAVPFLKAASPRARRARSGSSA